MSCLLWEVIRHRGKIYSADFRAGKKICKGVYWLFDLAELTLRYMLNIIKILKYVLF